MKKYVLICLMLSLFSCTRERKEVDAYGNFEATEIILSSQTSGTIVSLLKREGQKISKGDTLAIVDTTDICIKIKQLINQQETIQLKEKGIKLFLSNLIHELMVANNEKIRIHKLFDNNVATEEQKEKSDLKVVLLNNNILQQKLKLKELEKEKINLLNEYSLLKNKRDRCFIVSPENATLLNRYREISEYVRLGNPIDKIANLEYLVLRVYISGGQLAKVKLGDRVSIGYDCDNKIKHVSGVVEWISSKAEFTPKTIQTKEERIAQVYAVKIRVENKDKEIKIGMPGECSFNKSL
ncbi:MAG: HlyD family efflux transporter periplasmic adaptor subunit [Prolixibacteraceae bacterium]|nr:HlyD family efflux transporter periplasmic adaptor subunit [Prolixibacteraceae bacterium]